MPNVSVLMSIYNSEAYLREAIESILNQTYTEYEFIIVDDGSDDESPHIIREFAKLDSRINLLTQKNMGLATALNNGFTLCKGKYIVRMDADDVSLPYRISEQVEYLDNNPNCVLVGGLAKVISESGEVLGIGSGGPHKVTNLYSFPPRIAVSLHPLITVRKSALCAVNGYREEFTSAQDYDLFVRLSAIGSIDNPNRIMLLYRKHDDSVSRNKLLQQERFAALSELQAVSSLRKTGQLVLTGPLPAVNILLAHAKISKYTFEFYVNFRVWRRDNGAYNSQGNLIERDLWSSVFSVKNVISFDFEFYRLQLKVFSWLILTKIRKLNQYFCVHKRNRV